MNETKSPDRNPGLAPLDVLTGEWDVEIEVGEHRFGGAITEFDWIEGGAFMRGRTDAGQPDDEMPAEWVANSPLPTVVIIGLDEHSGAFSHLYADARGVHRVYEMTLADGLWRISGRPGPTFFQRFEGRVAADGQTIAARWEHSEDGEHWELDFELTYARRSG